MRGNRRPPSISCVLRLKKFRDTKDKALEKPQMTTAQKKKLFKRLP